MLNKKLRIAYELKPEQITALCVFIVKNDIASQLPTGLEKLYFNSRPFFPICFRNISPECHYE